MDENTSIREAILGDGRGFIVLTGLALCFSGAFALFLTATGQFLPHDAIHIGFTADELAILSPNLVGFMFHDRAAFGGALLAIGGLYLWLTAYPLGNGQRWAWQTLVISGVFGFGSFLAYIGYGYLDTWHGIATLFLLPVFVVGMVRSRRLLTEKTPLVVLISRTEMGQFFRQDRGMGLLHAYALGLIMAGVTISVIGMTTVFVSTDITFIELCGTDVSTLSENLLGVIAHDRAGFGGGLLTTGVTTWLILRNARFSRSLWETLLFAGVCGFSTAIGVHYVVGYTTVSHLAPAYAGAGIFVAGMVLTRNPAGRG